MNKREIRFRAWNTYDSTTQSALKKMVYFEIDGLDEDYIIGPGTYLKGDDLVVMQFTGLKDKNGVEIYEGDIIKTAYISKQAVEWINEMGAWSTCVLYIDSSLNGNKHEIEVIGNIYENPELL